MLKTRKASGKTFLEKRSMRRASRLLLSTSTVLVYSSREVVKQSLIDFILSNVRQYRKSIVETERVNASSTILIVCVVCNDTICHNEDDVSPSFSFCQAIFLTRVQTADTLATMYAHLLLANALLNEPSHHHMSHCTTSGSPRGANATT